MLVFAGDERFHPVSVEAYLERCDLFQRPAGWLGRLRRSVKLTASWDEQGSDRAMALGGLDGGHHLRYLDPEVRKARRAEKAGKKVAAAPPWAGLAILELILGAVWWFGPRSWSAPLGKGLLIAMGFVLVITLYGWMSQRIGLDRAGAVVLGAATVVAIWLVRWTWSDPVAWHRWGAQGLAVVLLYAVLQGWADRSLSRRAAVGLKSLSVLPITVAMVWFPSSWAFGRFAAGWITGFWAVVMLIVTFDDLMASFMAILSSLRREASLQAARSEKELRGGDEEGGYPYYGRVWRDEASRRIALQYFYFYAFNDWRWHDGLNFHEADWEWTTVFLDQRDEVLVPTHVVSSQHHSVKPRPWAQMTLAGGRHPVLFVAAGSHANYFERGRQLLPDLISGSVLSRLARPLLDSRQKSRQAADEGVSRYRSWLGRKVGERSERRSTADDPNGEGLVIGAVLPDELSSGRRRIGWRPVLLDGSQTWIDYRGLWGVRALLRNESGPPGPKWERQENLKRRQRRQGRSRRLWENPPSLLEAREPRAE